jgi:hypothetical protein
MTPAPNADANFQDVDRVHEPLEDEGAEVDGSLSAGFEPDEGSSTLIAECGEFAHGAADLIVAQGCAVYEFGLPSLKAVANANEIGAGGTEDDGEARHLRSVLKTDRVVHGFDGLEEVEAAGGWAGERLTAQAKGPDGEAVAKSDLPVIERMGAYGGDELRALASRIDDRDAGFGGEEGIFNDAKEAQLGLSLARENADWGALTGGAFEEGLRVTRHTQSHGAPGFDLEGAIPVGALEKVSEGLKGGEHPGFAQKTAGLDALAEGGDAGVLIEEFAPGRVSLADEEDHRV